MSTTISPASYRNASSPLRLSTSRTVLSGMISLGVALAANLVVLGVARLADADMVVRRDASSLPMTVGVGLVVVTTVLPCLLATLLLLPLRRWGARAWRAMAFVGLAIGILTVPLPLSMVSEGGTRASLASMHVLTGLIWFVVISRAAAHREEG